jgi:hypothetical protein
MTKIAVTQDHFTVMHYIHMGKGARVESSNGVEGYVIRRSYQAEIAYLQVAVSVDEEISGLEIAV